MNTPVSAYPSPSPSPVPPGPLPIGDLFKAAWAVYRQRFVLLITLMVLPTVLAFGAVIVGMLLLFGAFATPQIGTDPGAAVGSLSLIMLVLTVAIVAIGLYQYRVMGMVALTALDVAEGQASTWGGLHQRTRGMMLRVLVLGLLAYLASFLLLIITFVVILAPMLTARSSQDPFAAAGAGIGLVMLLYAALLPVTIFLVTRWAFFLPIMANEGVTGFEALRRSWRMTKGAFWPTLGTYLVGAVVVGVPSYFVTLIGSSITAFMTDPVTGMPSTGAMVVNMLLLALITLVTAPFMYVWIGLMYLSRGRELMGQTRTPPGFAAWVAGGQPPAPNYPPAPHYPPAPNYPHAPNYPPVPPQAEGNDGGPSPWGRPPTQ